MNLEIKRSRAPTSHHQVWCQEAIRRRATHEASARGRVCAHHVRPPSQRDVEVALLQSGMSFSIKLSRALTFSYPLPLAFVMSYVNLLYNYVNSIHY